MKILIIEDEVIIANLLRLSLEAAGNTTTVAHNGQDGLRIAESGDFAAIILDIMLPGMNGFQVAQTLRSKGIKTPIIMLTARNTPDDKSNSFAAGANAYLVKPASINELLSTIHKLTDKNQKNNGLSTIQQQQLFSAQSNSSSLKLAKDTPAAVDRKTKKNSIIEITALHKNIMDHAPISIITINKDGYVTSANKYFKKISKSKDFINHNVFTSKFFIRENLVDDYRQLLENGTPITNHHCHDKNSKGQDTYLKIIATPLHDTEGNINGALSMAIDNTEEVVSKNELISLNNNLELTIKKKTSELNETNDELKKALEIKSSFAADVSHEMRTSLAIIQGNLELMNRTGAITENGKESNEQILQEINRMSEMLTSLTSLTNAESASQKLNYSKINLRDLLSSVCNSLKVVANEKNISIELKPSTTQIELMADKLKIEELLMNLTRNAIKYNKPNGWIKIGARKSGNKICVKVEDGGIGISKKHLPFVFERFYRGDSARTRNSGGSGLGLAICKWIADIHGGDISVTSKIGQGSTFSVCLPTSPKNTLQSKLL